MQSIVEVMSEHQATINARDVGFKGVVIGQLLVSIIGVGALFSLYQQNLLMAHFWAGIVLLFTFALTMADLIGRLERRIEYEAHVRS
ncbi:hypothetical protein [Afifella pfennigii]|uniref:hypothetical protein n=1 Tax=Afifella pfennigii TaxID=209897 RepID=UPI00047A7DF6|nr:hypothetical protein [Afifella pfennigii]